MLQWALDVAFERDLGQYVTLRDVDTLNRLLDAAKQGNAPHRVNADITHYKGEELRSGQGIKTS
jgi:hypothetical protein